MIDKERYARQMMLPEIGEEGQLKLNQAKVLIIGLGGLGAPVATYLTGAGVGTIGLCDPDRVSLSNLQRQTLYTTEELGQPKVYAAVKRLHAMNPDINFRIHPQGLNDENARSVVGGYDIVVDCTDNFKTRFLIDDVCRKLNRPWVHGAIGEFNGQVSVMNHYGCRRYLTDLFTDQEYFLSLPQTVKGVLGAVPGVVGAIQACETIKTITGCGDILAGKLFTINLLTLQTETIEI